MAYDHHTTATGATAMRALTVGDLTPVGTEPRILDTVLGEQLGFERDRNIRDLIRNNLVELSGYEGLPRNTANLDDIPEGGVLNQPLPTGPKGGRPGRAYLLNEQQALLLCMFARTPNAAAVRKQLIEVFMAWRAGKGVTNREPLPTLQPAISHDRVTTLDYGNKTIRAVLREGVMWFVVRDICTAIGMVDPSSLAADLNPGEKDLYPFPSATGSHEMLIVSEIGLQVLLLRRRGVTTVGSPVYKLWYWTLERLWPPELSYDEPAAKSGLIPLTGDFQVGIYEMPGSDRKQLRATMPADMALPAMRHLLSGIEGAA